MRIQLSPHNQRALEALLTIIPPVPDDADVLLRRILAPEEPLRVISNGGYYASAVHTEEDVSETLTGFDKVLSGIAATK